MATRYVRKTGSDGNGGTSPSDAWLTIGKALGASGLASGDQLWVGAGTYRETVAVAMTSATAETKITGDVDGAMTGDAGEVIWTAYTTNDTTTPSATILLNLAGRDFLTFEKLTMIGAPGNVTINGSTTTNATNITFTDCTIITSTQNTSALVTYTGLANVQANWLFNRCCFLTQVGNAVTIILPTSASADYDANIVFRSCFFLLLSGTAISVATSGAAAFKPGGVVALNCTSHAANFMVATTGNVATSIPCQVKNCLILSGSSVALSANSTGQIVEDYNRIQGASARSNVAVGTHSISDTSIAPLYELGQALMVGRSPRPFLSPMAGSPLLGFGNDSSPTPPTVDLLNRPRPAGGGSLLPAVGAFERHDTAIREVTTVRTGTTALVIVGPGDHQFDVAVDAVSTVIACWMRFDTNHGTTTRPQVVITNGTECGVADQTITATGAVDTWVQVSATIVPTSAGVVTVRVVARPTAATGKLFVDDVTVV